MRDLIRRNRSSELERFRSGMDQLFADAFFRNWPMGSQDAFPPVDLFATDNSIVALVNMPGVDVKDVELTATSDSLTITGEIKDIPEKGDLIWQERAAGRFQRSFKLPVPIKADKVEADYSAGVLRIEMPKTDELKSRNVKIKVN